RRPVAAQLVTAVVAGGLLGLGLLPVSALHASALLWGVWLAVTVGVAALAGWLLTAAHGIGHLTAGMLTAAVLAWLLAPMFGLAGWLLRAPVLRAIVVATGSYLLTLRPDYFPVASSPREKAFCGVRP